VKLSFAVDAKKMAVIATFTKTVAGKDPVSGSVRIQRDPETGKLRSWGFEDDGAHSQGLWHNDGKCWLIECKGVLADGTTTARNDHSATRRRRCRLLAGDRPRPGGRASGGYRAHEADAGEVVIDHAPLRKAFASRLNTFNTRDTSMKRIALLFLIGIGTCTLLGDANGRGFGGGGRSFGGGGGFDRGGFSGGGSFGHTESGGFGNGFSSFSGSDARGGSYSGSRNTSSYSGCRQPRGQRQLRSHVHTAGGGSVNTSGSRWHCSGPRGGVVAGGNRDTTVTTAGGKTYSADRQGAVASGHGGRTVGGASGSVDGRYGTSSWNTAFAGNKYGAMDHYSSVQRRHRSRHGVLVQQLHHRSRGRNPHQLRLLQLLPPRLVHRSPGCWYAAGWAAGAAYNYANYATVSSYCGLTTSAAPDYDYGSTVVINNDQIYMKRQ